jgi:CubicO group peptidase (beta-lactamase class C family)
MLRRRFLHMLLALVLVSLQILTLTSNVPASLRVQSVRETKRSTATTSAPDLSASLAAIEKIVEEQRKEKGVPGLSIVIVKDDRVIYAKGFGMRDVERNLPVTVDTLFAIGSCTKAFTAMAAVMSQDEGKLSLDDSPKKYLPYFKINDPQIDEKITLRDLLSHRSGLPGTDIAWYTGALNREEVIRVAGEAKPTAKLGEKFQYQNVMYSAAGEAVAKAQNSTWEKIIDERFLRPLGMKASRLSIREMQRADDYSLGYEYNLETQKTRQLPMRDLTNIAPAGAINSNARDMAQWLRLLLGRGAFEGKRFVSEKGFDQLFSKITNIAPDVDYGMGWITLNWNDHKVALHDGGIDGFNAEVALMPDQRLGFVLLTNASQARLIGPVRNAVWKNLVGKPQASAPATASTPAAATSAATTNAATTNAAITPAASNAAASSVVEPASEVGIYSLAAANVEMKVSLKDGKLVLVVPGQPAYTLENVGGRRYKFVTDAPGDFFITFRPSKENAAEIEAYLEQPQGNAVLRKRRADDVAADAAADSKEVSSYIGPLQDTLGSYEGAEATLDITVKQGKIVLVVPGQPDYPLVEKEKDRLSSPALPDSYGVLIKRDAAGKVSAIVLKQPEGEFEFKRVAEFKAPIDARELMTKVIAAHGGEASLRKHKSLTSTYTLAFTNQGLTGEGTTSARAPNASAQSITFIALGKKIGWVREFFDGTSGGTETSFTLPDTKTGRQLANSRVQLDFYALPNWKTLYKSVTIKKTEKVGDEEAYVVQLTPERGSPITDYISTKSFLILKRTTLEAGEDGEDVPNAEIYSDYKPIDGVMIPFRTIQQTAGLGEVVIQLKEAGFDAPMPDSLFSAQGRK